MLFLFDYDLVLILVCYLFVVDVCELRGGLVSWF